MLESVALAAGKKREPVRFESDSVAVRESTRFVSANSSGLGSVVRTEVQGPTGFAGRGSLGRGPALQDGEPGPVEDIETASDLAIEFTDGHGS